MEFLVEVRDVYKVFSRSPWLNRKRGLRKVLNSLFGRHNEPRASAPGDFWALNGVSLKVRRGECVGVLGLNGAGKSTLLKVISGLYIPDRGKVSIRGNLESLIELSTGFHPSLTGRENIIMKCTLKGMAPNEINDAVQKIIEFSELEDFIDSPVKNYSSGMYARLGFSASIIMNPDILIIDEILSVGDFRFQQKCLQKINEFKKDAALLIVSHTMNTVKLFCDSVIVLEAGKIVFQGGCDEGISFYLNRELEHRQKRQDRQLSSRDPNIFTSTRKGLFGEELINGQKVDFVQVKINDHELSGSQIEITKDSAIRIDIQGRLKQHPQKFLIGIPIWDEKANLITALNSDLYLNNISVDEHLNFSVSVEIPNQFCVGAFKIAVALHDGPEYFYRQVLGTLSSSQTRAREMGYIRMDQSWKDEKIEAVF